MASLKLMDLKTSKSYYESATPNQETARYVLPTSTQVPYLVHFQGFCFTQNKFAVFSDINEALFYVH